MLKVCASLEFKDMVSSYPRKFLRCSRLSADSPAECAGPARRWPRRYRLCAVQIRIAPSLLLHLLLHPVGFLGLIFELLALLRRLPRPARRGPAFAHRRVLPLRVGVGQARARRLRRRRLRRALMPRVPPPDGGPRSFFLRSTFPPGCLGGLKRTQIDRIQKGHTHEIPTD